MNVRNKCRYKMKFLGADDTGNFVILIYRVCSVLCGFQ
jgi:hypothetical protein